jgi:hypothetical protein
MFRVSGIAFKVSSFGFGVFCCLDLRPEALNTVNPKPFITGTVRAQEIRADVCAQPAGKALI